MKRNTMSYKVKQFLMFAGPATVLFFAVVILPFVYGLYLTFTSWDGISKTKPFVGLANYLAAFKDAAYWQALGRTFIYSAIAVILVNVVAFLLAYLVWMILVIWIYNTRGIVWNIVSVFLGILLTVFVFKDMIFQILASIKEKMGKKTVQK